MQHHRFSIFLLAAAIVLSSCSVSATLEVKADRSAQFSGSILLDPTVQLYWNDLKELDSKLPAKPLDPTLFQKSFDQKIALPHSNYTSGKAAAKGENGIDLSLSISDLNRVGSSMTDSNAVVPSIVELKSEKGQTTLTLTLDRKSFKTLVDLTAYGKSQSLSSLIPDEKNKVKTPEYRDLLTYLLEPYTKTPGPIVDASKVELKIVLPRSIVSSKGTKSVQGNVAICQWPLVSVLVLEQPIVVSVTY